jgi:RNA polymerase sigma-70 factor (ECF subfamily)
MADSPDPRTAHVQMLFIQHASQLRGFIIALMPDFSRVDDVLQETFLTITKKAASFEPGSNFLGWACAIARYKVLEGGRKAAAGGQPFAPEVIESLCACAPEPEPEDERMKVLAECLSQLAPQARRAVELRYQQAHKPSEIARLLGWTPNSTYVALSRAREVLKSCVELKIRAQAI